MNVWMSFIQGSFTKAQGNHGIYDVLKQVLLFCPDSTLNLLYFLFVLMDHVNRQTGHSKQHRYEK